MSDPLESKILSGALTNPGSTHGISAITPSSSESDSEGERQTHLGLSSGTGNKSTSSFLTTGHSHGKFATRTGPKGVLADWMASREAVTSGGRQGHQHRDTSSGLASSVRRMKINGNGGRSMTPDSADGTSEGEDEAELGGMSEGEKMAMRSWRRARKDEVRGVKKDPVGSTKGKEHVGRKWFGHLREIGLEQFETAVLGEGKDVKVVLFLYEPDMASCQLLSTHLSSLARQYPRTKFLRAVASDLDFAIDTADDVLPTLLVYRAGELEKKLVAVDREWGRSLSAGLSDVRAVLARNGLIDLRPGEILPARSSALSDDDED